MAGKPAPRRQTGFDRGQLALPATAANASRSEMQTPATQAADAGPGINTTDHIVLSLTAASVNHRLQASNALGFLKKLTISVFADRPITNLRELYRALFLR
ncbi:hypothetical protein E2562_007791 [Oryza meyeriana var. granulata]|uniref:Uncharacterized protein n=1 Tax=Oryza meyeriana var. granulata TaxID=110450 RepID=A0A6G1EHU5_9ORYZ|nr:hypothetical protein E2562_007791 [Oryza meyeriana var. granulata]